MNNLKPYIHDDKRRTIIEWIQDMPFKTSKVVKAKGKVILGKHYHNNKDEVYFVLQGKGIFTLSGKRNFRTWLYENESIFVPRGVTHTFELWPDTILLGVATERFDPDDEIQVTD
jgi:mannose-6-phosphate isomerase-like protein (cupin superfamily)